MIHKHIRSTLSKAAKSLKQQPLSKELFYIQGGMGGWGGGGGVLGNNTAVSLINSATNTGVPVDSTLARYIKDAGMETKNNNNNKN